MINESLMEFGVMLSVEDEMAFRVAVKPKPLKVLFQIVHVYDKLE